MSKQKRYRLRDSDRSGFTYREIELVKDKGALVGPDEFDAPPPSNQSTGGEGDVDRSSIRANWESTSAVNVRPTQVVSASVGIAFQVVPDSAGKSDPNNSWQYIAGATATTNISANPQISRGRQNSIITIQCVSNNVILTTGNGLSLSRIFNMDSGAILNLIYNATDNLWHETSRSHIERNLGV